jgi:hypothetical protein
MSEEQSTAEQFEQRLETAKHVNQTLAQCLKDARPADDDLVQETIGLHYAWMKEITIHGGKAIYKLLTDRKLSCAAASADLHRRPALGILTACLNY